MHLLVLGVMYAELSSRIGLDLVFLGSKMIVAMAWNLYSLAGILCSYDWKLVLLVKLRSEPGNESGKCLRMPEDALMEASALHSKPACFEPCS